MKSEYLVPIVTESVNKQFILCKHANFIMFLSIIKMRDNKNNKIKY